MNSGLKDNFKSSGFDGYEAPYESEIYDSLLDQEIKQVMRAYKKIAEYYENDYSIKGAAKRIISTWLMVIKRHISCHNNSELTDEIKTQLEYVTKDFKNVNEDDFKNLIYNLWLCKKQFKLSSGQFIGNKPSEFREMSSGYDKYREEYDRNLSMQCKKYLIPMTLLSKSNLDTLNMAKSDLIKDGMVQYYNPRYTLYWAIIDDAEYSYRKLAWDLSNRIASDEFNTRYYDIMSRYLLNMKTSNKVGKIIVSKMICDISKDSGVMELLRLDLMIRLGVVWYSSSNAVDMIDIIDKLAPDKPGHVIKQAEYMQLVSKASSNPGLYATVRAIVDLMAMWGNLDKLKSWASTYKNKNIINCSIPYFVYANCMSIKIGSDSNITYATRDLVDKFFKYCDTNVVEVAKHNIESIQALFSKMERPTIETDGSDLELMARQLSGDGSTKETDDLVRQFNSLFDSYIKGLKKSVDMWKSKSAKDEVVAKANALALENMAKSVSIFGQVTYDIKRNLAREAIKPGKTPGVRPINSLVSLTIVPSDTADLTNAIKICGITKEPFYSDVYAPLMTVYRSTIKFDSYSSGIKSTLSLDSKYACKSKTLCMTYQCMAWKLIEDLPSQISKLAYNTYIRHSDYIHIAEETIFSKESPFTDMYYLDAYLRYGIRYRSRVFTRFNLPNKSRDAYIELAALAHNRPELYAIARASNDYRHGKLKYNGASSKVGTRTSNALTIQDWLLDMAKAADMSNSSKDILNLYSKMDTDDIYLAMYIEIIRKEMENRLECGSNNIESDKDMLKKNMVEYIDFNLQALNKWHTDYGVPSKIVSSCTSNTSSHIATPASVTNANAKWNKLFSGYESMLGGRDTFNKLRKECNDDYDKVNRLLFTLKLFGSVSSCLDKAMEIAEEEKIYSKFVNAYYKNKSNPDAIDMAYNESVGGV